jgi:hypothetical protein
MAHRLRLEGLQRDPDQHKNAELHLSAAYRELGIRSRRELAAASA